MTKERCDQMTISLCGLLVVLLMSFPTESWIPAVLVGVYAITSYPHMPDFNGASTNEMIQWHIVRPMLAAGAAISMLLVRGAEEDPTLFALGIAVTATFMMGNMVAFTVAAIPELLRHPQFREAAKQKPATFAMTVFVIFLVVMSVLSMLENK